MEEDNKILEILEVGEDMEEEGSFLIDQFTTIEFFNNFKINITKISFYIF